jgi:2'-5' RNA ligase
MNQSNQSDSIRAFLALEIPSSLKQHLTEQQQELRQRLPSARWVRPQGLHLTVKFLGDASREVLGELTGQLQPRLEALRPVTVSLEGSGFFPSPRRPRVAWIGGQAHNIEPVVEAVESVAKECGFAREKRRWSLHLTMARLRKPWPPPAVESFLEWGRSLRLDPFTCTEVVLFSSTLKPDGAVYTALDRMGLAGLAEAAG